MNLILSTYRLIALILAFLMFSTSVGFALDMHYCSGKLKSVNFFGKAKTCHEMTVEAPMKNCPHHQKMVEQIQGCSIENKDCCENKTLRFQSDQDQQVQTFDFVVNKQLQQFITAYVVIFFNNNFSIESDTPSFAHYKPPLILRDIPVLIQSFLL